MIKVGIYKDSNGLVNGCKIVGHARYAESGQDIVCSAISILTYTIASAIQRLLNFQLDGDMSDGRMEFFLADAANDQTQLLFETMLIGLSEIAQQYPKKVRIYEERR
ncbi:MAG: ribosomal-processing cysteine protease Prp [Negativicutes bacterium]|jgi:hypothetical protein